MGSLGREYILEAESLGRAVVVERGVEMLILQTPPFRAQVVAVVVELTGVVGDVVLLLSMVLRAIPEVGAREILITHVPDRAILAVALAVGLVLAVAVVAVLPTIIALFPPRPLSPEILILLVPVAVEEQQV